MGYEDSAKASCDFEGGSLLKRAVREQRFVLNQLSISLHESPIAEEENKGDQRVCVSENNLREEEI